MTAPVPSAGERWSILVEFGAAPCLTPDAAPVSFSGLSVDAAVVRLLNDDFDLWPERVEVYRLAASLRVNGDTQ